MKQKERLDAQFQQMDMILAYPAEICAAVRLRSRTGRADWQGKDVKSNVYKWEAEGFSFLRCKNIGMI